MLRRVDLSVRILAPVPVMMPPLSPGNDFACKPRPLNVRFRATKDGPLVVLHLDVVTFRKLRLEAEAFSQSRATVLFLQQLPSTLAFGDS